MAGKVTGGIKWTNESTFRKHVDSFAREYGLTAKDVMEDQHGLLIKDLIFASCASHELNSTSA